MKKWFACLLVLVMVFGLGLNVVACTSLAVPPESTVDGSAFVTHTADCGSCAYEIVKVPAQDWEPGTMVDILHLPQSTGGYQVGEIAAYPTGNRIPQVAHTYGYISGLFGMINEKQVAWGETTFGGDRALRNPSGWFDVTNLSMLAMERASTAREAIQVMGDLAVKYGYKDGGESVSLCDPNEAWIFEIVGCGPLWEQGLDAPGAFWVAQRVPAGHVAASANAAVIDEIDWDDHENFMYGPGIREHAQAMGLDENFSWRFDFVKSDSPATSGRRVWRVFSLVAPSLTDSLDEADLPFSVPVDEKISLQDIMAINRDHYEDTEFDGRYSLTAGPWNNPRRYRGLNFTVDGERYHWQRSISQIQCEYSIIAQVRGFMPDEVGAVLWYGADAPDTTCYVPFWPSQTEISEVMNSKAGSHQKFTRDSYWWSISTVATYADLKWSYMIQDINAMQEKYETSIVNSMPAIEVALIDLLDKDRDAALEFVTSFANRNVENVRDAWWEFLDYLMWKYNSGFVMEDGRVNSVGYPEDWLRRVLEADDLVY